MRPPLELRPPRPPRWSLLALGASVAIHALLMLGSVDGRLPNSRRPPARLIVLGSPDEGRAVDMRYQSRRPVPAGGRRVQKAARPHPPASVRASPNVLVETKPRTVPAANDSGAVTPASAGVERIGPGLARGRLWVRPLPLPPKELAGRLTRSHAQLVDSAVSAVVQAFLDSVAAEPANRDARLPSWTTEVAGKKFGLDSRNLYVAGLKIPAAVLALLPLPGGNLDQNKAYSHIMDLRSDIQYAARRAENAEEFKQMIRDMRQRKEREREFARNQRHAPGATDTAAVARAGGKSQ